jgi:hypothetical protein
MVVAGEAVVAAIRNGNAVPDEAVAEALKARGSSGAQTVSVIDQSISTTRLLLHCRSRIGNSFRLADLGWHFGPVGPLQSEFLPSARVA